MPNNNLNQARKALKDQERMLDQMNQEPETWTFDDQMRAQEIEQEKLKRITRQVGRNWKKKARSKKVARKTKATRNWKKLSRKVRNNPARAEGFETIQRTNSMPDEPEPGVLDQVDRALRSGIRASVKSVKSFFGQGKKKRKSNKKNKKNTKRNKKNTMKRNKKNKKKNRKK